MSRISASITAHSITNTDTTATLSATGQFKYASGSWGWTVSGYLRFKNSAGTSLSSKSISNVKSSTSGGSFGSTTYSYTVNKTHEAQTITAQIYGYCTDSTSDTASATYTFTVPAKTSYVITLDNEGTSTTLTKWHNEELALPTPTKQGYSFKGWRTADGNVYTDVYNGNKVEILSAVYTYNATSVVVNNKSVVRDADTPERCVISVDYSLGTHGEGSLTPVSSIQIEYKALNSSTWISLATVQNPNNPFTYTTPALFSKETAYNIRIKFFDAYFPQGVVIEDLLTKTAYIWKAKVDYFDFGVPVSVDDELVLVESDLVPLTQQVAAIQAQIDAAIEKITWKEIATSTGTTAKTWTNLQTAGYQEVLVVADVTRNNAHHYASAVLTTAVLNTTQYEVKLSGGYYATSVNFLAQYKIGLTGGAGVTCHINGTSYISTTTWHIYVR